MFVDLGAQTLRVRHSDRVYEVSLRRFGFDTGRLRPVVEVRNGQRSEGAGDPLRQTASLKARIAANPWDGWRLRVEPTTSCLLYTSPSPRDATLSRMPSSA